MNGDSVTPLCQPQKTSFKANCISRDGSVLAIVPAGEVPITAFGLLKI
jgi:hypothetical protein